MTCFKALLIICLSTLKKTFAIYCISVNYKDNKNSKNDFLNVFDDIYFYMSFLILIFAEHS